jgi:DNA-directed RNA polymerase II subunit RPB2
MMNRVFPSSSAPSSSSSSSAAGGGGGGASTPEAMAAMAAMPAMAPSRPDLKGEGEIHPRSENTVLSRSLLDKYFKTFEYPFTRHHIDSFDHFLAQDLPAIIKSNNPFLLLKEKLPDEEGYKYKVEIFVGGEDGSQIKIGTPTISLQRTKEVRLLFPNEARLRGLTYGSEIRADILVRFTLTLPQTKPEDQPAPIEKMLNNVPLCDMPILLHSRNCILHGKPQSFVEETGECSQDHGGYFIIDGSEKVLITRQEQAFNTLYVKKLSASSAMGAQVETYGNMTCLSPITRQVKMVGFYWSRKLQTLTVTLPMVRKPVPLFVLFRALGYQSDKEILELIYPDLNSSEARQMAPLLTQSICEANPFMDQFSAITFMKTMTKGFTEYHVWDILFNKFFIHITDGKLSTKAHFLAECVRKFMRVHLEIDPKTDRDELA